MAPEVGLEPTTLRLTAECSAIELLRIALQPQLKREKTRKLLLFVIANALSMVKALLSCTLACQQLTETASLQSRKA